jgi:hypothetical protein
MSSRRNVQVIDGARNCTYDIFSMPEKDFELMFPGEGQDVEFIEDFIERVGDAEAARVADSMWASRENKKSIGGIHGTLFYELNFKKAYYPSKREDKMTGFPRRKP